MPKTGPLLNGKPTTWTALRLFVFQRDRTCLEFQRDRMHVCQGRFGRWHQPWDQQELTLEHVPTVHSVSDGRKDDERHCVAACHEINVIRHSPAIFRDFARSRLRKLYPDCEVNP